MTSMISQKLLTEPATSPYPGLLLDAATVIDSGDLWFNTDGMYETYACGDMEPVPTSLTCFGLQLPAPTLAAPTVANETGTLADGDYRFIVTAIDGAGAESGPSNEVVATILAPNDTIHLSWSAVTGATGYNVFVSDVDGATGTERILATTVGTLTTYTYAADGYNALARAVPTAASSEIPDKTYGAPTWVDGWRFGLQSGVVCKPLFGDDTTDMEAKLRDQFLLQESSALSGRIAESMFQFGTDLSGASAVEPIIGVGILEAAFESGGVLPTFHASRGLIPRLAENGGLTRSGNNFQTFQGSLFAASSNYGQVGPGTIAAGESWLVATGPVQIVRSELVTRQAVKTTTNERFAIAERLYIVSLGCATRAVKVKETV